MAGPALRRLLTGSVIAWAALLPVAPFAASQRAPAPLWYGLAFLVYGAGSLVCHQLPERSFYIGAAQMPVCARCTGIYVGAALAALLVGVRRKIGPTNSDRVRTLLAVAILPTIVTLIYEWVTGDTPSNAVRAVAGAPLGAAVAFVVMSAVG
ncbi:MAG TPA: DUF2085 domain-containing protein [Vicinamibacterales bacterium]|jgi:uncharacterized membrane protein|nr:DUF2085 domain-containing protein [Vicinamibacterales bacterium]